MEDELHWAQFDEHAVQEVDDARKYPAPHVVQVMSVLLGQSNQLLTVHDLVCQLDPTKTYPDFQ